jgi:Tol biopolymer transport system component
VAALRRFITLVTVLAAALLGGVAATAPAQAKAPGANGQIVFGRYSTGLGDFQIFTVNPDGTNEAQVLSGAAECPRWSPGGARILVCVADPGGLVRPATVRPDGSGFALLENPDRSLNLGCWAWSPNGARLACEGWDDTNPNRPPGVFTVRSADGGGLVRVTANPNGNHDIPGDYSPGGGRIVFLRVTDSDSESGTLFVVNAGGSGLRRITAPGFAEDSGSWSPDGKWILFSNNKQKLFVVHPDGTGLHQINLDISGSYFASEPAWSPDGTKIVLRLFLASTGQQHLSPSGQPAQTCTRWPTPKAAKNSPTGDPTRWPAQRPRRYAHQQQTNRQHSGRRGASGVTSERRGPAQSSPGQGANGGKP